MSKIKVLTTKYTAEKTTSVTVALDDLTATGMASCNPSDKFSRDVGYSIALARALKGIAEELETLWIGRAISYKEWKSRH